MAIGILALGAYVPREVIGNELIAQWADTTPQWIEDRTGIVERRYADRDMPTSGMAYWAVLDLVDRYPDALEGVGAIVVATSTPDQPQPATAVILQDRLGLWGVPAFDINAVCSGFLYGLVVGAALATQPSLGSRVLVVGADKYSDIMDGGDPRTVSLFGDGAGAAVLGAVPEGFGIRASRLLADGRYRELVQVVGGGSRRPLDAEGIKAGVDRFRMDGPAVRRFLDEQLPQMIEAVVDEAGIGVKEVDRLVLHQANPRLLRDLVLRMGVDPNNVPLTATHYGNTAAASIPITLAHTHAARPFDRGEQVLLGAVGGGMTAGAMLITWY